MRAQPKHGYSIAVFSQKLKNILILAVGIFFILSLQVTLFTHLVSAERVGYEFLGGEINANENYKTVYHREFDSNDNVISYGLFTGESHNLHTESGQTDLRDGTTSPFVTKEASDGSYLWSLSEVSNGTFWPVEIQTDSADNIYIAGEFSGTLDMDLTSGIDIHTSINNSVNGFVSKYDTNGNYQWTIVVGGGRYDDLNDIAVSASGRVYMVGDYNGVADFDYGLGVAEKDSEVDGEAYLVVYDIDGSFIEVQTFANQSPSTDFISLYGVSVDSVDNVYIAGLLRGSADLDPAPSVNIISSPNPSTQSAFITKLNSDMTYAWSKVIGNNQYGQNVEVLVDSSDDAYLFGTFSGTLDFNPDGPPVVVSTTGTYDRYNYVNKYSSDGTFNWNKIISTNTSLVTDYSTNSLGDLFVSGRFSGTVNFNFEGVPVERTSVGSSYVYDGFISKIDSSGVFVDVLSYGSPDTSEYFRVVAINGNDEISTYGNYSGSVDLDPLGASNIVSSASSRYFSARYDMNLQLQLVNVYENDYENGNYYTTDMIFDENGNLYRTIRVYGEIDIDPSDQILMSSAATNTFYLQKINSDGELLWTNELAVWTWSSGKIQISNDGVVLAGYFSGTVDFDPNGTGDTKVSNSGSNDVFVTKYMGDGSYAWTQVWGSSDYDGVSGFAINNDQELVFTGSIASATDFDPGAGDAIYSPTDSNDAYINILDNNGEYVSTQIVENTNEYRPGDIKFDSSGNMYLEGYYRTEADLDITSGTDIRTATGFSTEFITKINADGSYAWSVEESSNISFYTFEINDNNGDIYITGQFSDTADFDHGAGDASRTEIGGYWGDAFLMKWNSDGEFEWVDTWGGGQEEFGNRITVGPNGFVYVTGGTYNYLYENDTAFLDFSHTDPGGERAAFGQTPFLSVFEDDGTWLDTITFSHGGEVYAYDDALAVNRDGVVYFAGETNGYSIKLNPSQSDVLTPAYGDGGISARYKYTRYNHIVNLPTGLQVVSKANLANNVSDLIGGGIENTKTDTLLLRKNNTNAPIASFDVTATQDYSWNNSFTADSDISEGKAFVHNLTIQPGAPSEFSLYVPKISDETSFVRVCPSASSISEITDDCNDGYNISVNDDRISIEEVNGVEYFVISGLTGTGAMNVLADSVTQNEELANTGISVVHRIIFALIIISITYLAFNNRKNIIYRYNKKF